MKSHYRVNKYKRTARRFDLEIDLKSVKSNKLVQIYLLLYKLSVLYSSILNVYLNICITHVYSLLLMEKCIYLKFIFKRRLNLLNILEEMLYSDIAIAILFYKLSKKI